MSLIAEIKLEILQSLSQNTSHGYKLHKEVGVATSTVYNHLDELEKEGMVASEPVEEDTRGKTEYRITERGEDLLELLTETNTDIENS